MNPDRQKKSTVTLEDLLRLKRAERPPEEFWGQFDRDLRAKQLAAIIEPRPWWAPLIRVGARFSRYQLPVGAAAILALSLVTVREYRSTDLAPAFTPAAPAATIAVAAPVLSAAAPQTSLIASDSVQNAAGEVSAPVSQPEVVAPVVVDVMPQPSAAPASFAVLGEGFARETAQTPSSRYMAATLAAAQESDLNLAETLVRPTRAVAARPAVREPLTQISSPSEARLARLLAPGLSNAVFGPESGAHATERVARSLTEDRLYDTVSRVNARGAGVLVKF